MTEIDLPTLIRELGLSSSKDPVEQLRRYCFEKVERWVHEHGGVEDIDELFRLVCDKASVKVEIIESDDDPAEIAARYFGQGDPALARVRSHDWTRTDGLCFLRRNRKPWKRWFVAVVDARGAKASRAYFSKWHEVVHALTWPPQLRLAYRENLIEKKSPLEQAVDQVAAQLAFYDPILRPVYEECSSDSECPSFALVREVRRKVAPEASLQSVAIKCVTSTSTPALFIVAKEALKVAERRKVVQAQGSLFEGRGGLPDEKLRAIQVVANQAAMNAGLFIPENFQVPSGSVIAQLYERGFPGQIEVARENLCWWESGGRPRPNLEVRVEARRSGPVVYAFVTMIAKPPSRRSRQV